MSVDYPEWMNEKQQKCYRMLCDLMGGEHHIQNKVTAASPRGIATTIAGDLATYDMDELTKLIVMAHDRGIRASISPANMQYVRLMLHVREYRAGHTGWNRHPTLERHVAIIREATQIWDNLPDDLVEPAAPTAKGE